MRLSHDDAHELHKLAAGQQVYRRPLYPSTFVLSLNETWLQKKEAPSWLTTFVDCQYFCNEWYWLKYKSIEPHFDSNTKVLSLILTLTFWESSKRIGAYQSNLQPRRSVSSYWGSSSVLGDWAEVMGLLDRSRILGKIIGSPCHVITSPLLLPSRPILSSLPQYSSLSLLACRLL